MKNSLIILMDCWAYRDTEVDLQDKNLRKPVMQNINQFLQNNTSYTVISACYNHMPLHPDLNAKLIDHHITTIEEFKNFFLSQNFDAIWYLGLHWNRCIRSRELGYQCVSEFIQQSSHQCKILTKPSCTLELKEVYPGKQHSPVYEQLANFEDQTITMTKKISFDEYLIQGTNPNWNGKII